MSRAMNINAEQAEVIAKCAKHGAAISAIETLLSGGTRVVLMNADDAAVIRKSFASKLIKSPVTRTRWVRNG